MVSFFVGPHNHSHFGIIFEGGDGGAGVDGGKALVHLQQKVEQLDASVVQLGLAFTAHAETTTVSVWLPSNVVFSPTTVTTTNVCTISLDSVIPRDSIHEIHTKPYRHNQQTALNDIISRLGSASGVQPSEGSAGRWVGVGQV